MKIAFITVGDPSRRTGGYLYHREVFTRLRTAGHIIDEHVLCEADTDSQLTAQPHVKIEPLDYDVLVVDALARVVVAPWIARWQSLRPVVAMVHELPSAAGDDHPKAREWEAPLLQADRLIAVSADGAATLFSRGVDLEQIAIASGGYNRLPAVNVEKPDDGRVRALAVAQWIPRKGLLELLNAWIQVAQPGDLLELVGETDVHPVYAAAIREILAKIPEDQVVVHGPIDDEALVAAYVRADLFALPSRYEGYGIVYAEALSYGLPVLAYAVGPLPDLIGPKAGFLIPPDEPLTLAEGLRRMLRNPDLRRSMSVAARARAAVLPTWDDTAAAFLRALRG